MLHELLIALGGCPGSIFVERVGGKIQVVSDLPFVSPSEVNLLNRLCVLATYYKQLKDFIQHNGPMPSLKTGESGTLHGMYLHAFCTGLDDILDPYRAVLLRLEQEVLCDPHLTASHLQCMLEEYHELFPALSAILEQIQHNKAHGCYILEVVHRNAMSGAPVIRQSLLRILHNCHKVLYKQLTAWLLHGLLLDDHSEFFIHKTTSDEMSSEVVDNGKENDLGLGGITGRHLQQIMGLTDVYRSGSIYEQFAVNAALLPTYIPLRIANKILFVGESVQLFSTRKDKLNRNRTGSILKGKADEFSQGLHLLSQQTEFVLLSFEAKIDEVRTYVSERLWQLVVEDSDLVTNLRIMKDFYLLGRGELFLAFIDLAHFMLSSTVSPSLQHDVNMAFQQAARNVLFEDEKLMQRFTLSVNSKQPKKSIGDTSGENGWSALGLTYSAEWPLHILFTPSIVDRYNAVFQFLLSVKRAQLDLQKCWGLQMQRKHRATKEADSIVWNLRNHMNFLMDNFQYYLQVDVIESQFSILLDKIHKTRDFEEIRFAHEQFVTSLLGQSFLLMRPIYLCMCDILDICHQFCGTISNSDAEISATTAQQIDNIAKMFQKQSSLLFRILSSVRSHQASPHLSQLLLRIDFNKYFTNAGGQLGSYECEAVQPSITKSSSRQN